MSQTYALGILISLSIGFALGCVYVLLRTRRTRCIADPQIQSLKETAREMISKGSLAGLNPHKVLRLCAEYEEMKADNQMYIVSTHCVRRTVQTILRDYDRVEDIYYFPESVRLDILAGRKPGSVR